MFSSTFKHHHRQRKRKFVICGNNGNSLVEKALVKRGWDAADNEDFFHLKWTELKSHIDYEQFVEGKQLANHISSSGCITTKSGLLNSLRSYFGSLGQKEPSSELGKFFPETYRLGDCREREKLLNTIGEDELWICKPTNSNQGKGIFLIKGKKELADYIDGKKKQNKMRASHRIVQRYIASPLLIHGRKFDIRVYLLVGSTRPYNVFFHSGYLRLAVNIYDTGSSDLTIHLTNQYVQKKNPNYSESKNDTIWSMEQFQEYLDKEGYTERLSLRPNWVFTDLHERMRYLAHTVFKAAQSSLTPKVGLFDLYGLDFMLDESLNVWLLEVNTNPALHTHCTVLVNMLPCMIDETLGICIELFDKKVAGLPTFPIASLNNFELIFSSAKDAMQNAIEFPLFNPEKRNGFQFINRGSDLSPIKCTVIQKPSKSAPPRRIKRTSFKKSENSNSSNSSSTTKTLKGPNLKGSHCIEVKKEEPPPQVPLKLALIEVAPCPKQDVL